MKKFLIAFAMFALFSLSATTVSANPNGGTWSNQITYNVHSGNTTWESAGVTSTSNTKSLSSGGWDIYVFARTMSSRPIIRLSTAGGVGRSNALTVPSGNGSAAGSGNTASPGNSVRTQVRTAYNQVTNNQTIRYQFSAR